jgi:putative ABC transport system permease protein
MHEGGCTSCPWTIVVGVVTEVKYAGLDKPDEGTVYEALSPSSRMRYLAVRTGADTAAVQAEIRAAVRSMDAALPFSNVATIDDLVDRALSRPRSLSLLVGAFAIVALLLSVVGIYGVMAYHVQQHTREIGIRLALGGSRGDLFKLVVGHGMLVVCGGVALGLAAASIAARAVSSLLFGVGALDPATFAAVAAIMVGVALLACAFPAHRAIAVEPALVLRDE